MKETFDRFLGEINVANVVYHIQNRNEVISDSNFRLLFKMISFLDISDAVTIELGEAAALGDDHLDSSDIRSVNCTHLELNSPDDDNIFNFL